MPTAMVISPHADDAAAFCSATLAKFAERGWRSLQILTSGFWALAFLATPLYSWVFPRDAARLHGQMQERRSIILEQA